MLWRLPRVAQVATRYAVQVTHRTATAALIVFYTLCALAVTGPGLLLVGDGLLAGLPIALVWTVAWVLLSFAALAVSHHVTAGGRPDAPERDTDEQANER